ncbi:hypothetical protein GCM10009612_49060 [Streptomyces beijiangensis]
MDRACAPVLGLDGEVSGTYSAKGIATRRLRFADARSSLQFRAGRAVAGHCAVRPELVSALQSQGAYGQRALSLLWDAVHILNCPSVFRAPYEVARCGEKTGGRSRLRRPPARP